MIFNVTSGKTYCKDNKIELYTMVIDFPEETSVQENAGIED